MDVLGAQVVLVSRKKVSRARRIQPCAWLQLCNCATDNAGFREAEIANVPFLGALAGCSARRFERSVASHTSEEQRRNAPGSAAKNGILAFSASLTIAGPGMAGGNEMQGRQL